MKFKSFVNFPKKIKEIITIFYIFDFLVVVLTFYIEVLCFVIFILSLRSNALTLVESIFKYKLRL